MQVPDKSPKASEQQLPWLCRGQATACSWGGLCQVESPEGSSDRPLERAGRTEDVPHPQGDQA